MSSSAATTPCWVLSSPVPSASRCALPRLDPIRTRQRDAQQQTKLTRLCQGLRCYNDKSLGQHEPRSMRSPLSPPELGARTHGTNGLTSTQRQWKDIKQKYLEGAEEEE